MKIFTKRTTLEAAIERINWIYDEFENVQVTFSGGKDSTVVLNLALSIAAQRGRLPVPVVFIDQEAEWQSTIDYVRTVMYDPRVKPIWLQVPFRIFNATSTADPWLQAWDPDKKDLWIHPQDPIAITQNVYGTDRFKELFDGQLLHDYPNSPVVSLGGVRCEESPQRRLALTSYEAYKGRTWGKIISSKRGHYVMYPIYDWAYSDVWKYIHESGVPYCKVYDYQYQYGVPVQKMRVSNLHHETALHSLHYLQEVERETWERLTVRLRGVNTAGQMQGTFMGPRKVPPMFKDWREYRDHLLENLIVNPRDQERLRDIFERSERRYLPEVLPKLWSVHTAMVLTNDTHGTKLEAFDAANFAFAKNRGRIRSFGKPSKEPPAEAADDIII